MKMTLNTERLKFNPDEISAAPNQNKLVALPENHHMVIFIAIGIVVVGTVAFLAYKHFHKK